MTLIIFTVISFLTCGFLIFCFVQWKRDEHYKPGSLPTRTDEVGRSDDIKRLHVVGSEKAESDQLQRRSRRSGSEAPSSGERAPLCSSRLRNNRKVTGTETEL